MENISEKSLAKSHLVNIYNREKMDITGVTEVISSTEKEIFARLQNVVMTIQGSDLRVVKLIPEEELLSVTGKINALRYDTKINKKSFMSKVFK